MRVYVNGQSVCLKHHFCCAKKKKEEEEDNTNSPVCCVKLINVFLPLISSSCQCDRILFCVFCYPFFGIFAWCSSITSASFLSHCSCTFCCLSGVWQDLAKENSSCSRESSFCLLKRQISPILWPAIKIPDPWTSSSPCYVILVTIMESTG